MKPKVLWSTTSNSSRNSRSTKKKSRKLECRSPRPKFKWRKRLLRVKITKGLQRCPANFSSFSMILTLSITCTSSHFSPTKSYSKRTCSTSKTNRRQWTTRWTKNFLQLERGIKLRFTNTRAVDSSSQISYFSVSRWLLLLMPRISIKTNGTSSFEGLRRSTAKTNLPALTQTGFRKRVGTRSAISTKCQRSRKLLARLRTTLKNGSAGTAIPTPRTKVCQVSGKPNATNSGKWSSFAS